jgi:PTH1 family peptidyl-tRNA hydrolase
MNNGSDRHLRLVVGLGNPGDRYRRTRHNLGFMVVDALAARGGAGRGREEHGAWVAEATVGGEPALLVKPLSFMNRSGGPVVGLLAAHVALPSDLVVVLDDIALELGVLRIRERGSHGGHNGLRSIIEALDTEDFPRLRLGIQKGEPPADLAEFVLSDFPAEDVLVVQEMVGYAAEAVECQAREGTVAAMSRYNGPRRA